MRSAANTIELRWLTAEDAAAFQALRLTALQTEPSAFGSSYEEEKDNALDDVAQRIAPAAGRTIVGAWLDGQLVGTLAIRRKTSVKQGHQAVIWGVYVAAGARGQGIAQAMLAQVLVFARQQTGLAQVHLGVTVGNAAALRLYEAAGFHIYGTEPAALNVDGQLFDEHLMVLRLDC